VLLYGTGFGPTEPATPAGDIVNAAVPLRDQATIVIGGVTLAAADVLYAGLAPGFAGLYQFNVRLPATLADGDVPVSIRVGNVQTQDGTTLPVLGRTTRN